MSDLYQEAVDAANALTDDELGDAAQGCTELSCMYHGPINQVRMDRGIHPRQQQRGVAR